MMNESGYRSPIKKKTLQSNSPVSSSPADSDYSNEKLDESLESLRCPSSPILDTAGLFSLDGYSTHSLSRGPTSPLQLPLVDDSLISADDVLLEGESSSVECSVKRDFGATDFSLQFKLEKEINKNKQDSHFSLGTHVNNLIEGAEHPCITGLISTDANSRCQTPRPPTPCDKSPNPVTFPNPVSTSSTNDDLPTPATCSIVKQKSKDYEIGLTDLALTRTRCCTRTKPNGCLSKMKLGTIKQARILWAEKCSTMSLNDALLQFFKSMYNPITKTTTLTILGHRDVCMTAVGMLYNVKHTHLANRRKEAQEGRLRFVYAPRTSMTDRTTFTEIKCYIERIAKRYGDMMPHTGKRVIPTDSENLRFMFIGDTGRECSQTHWLRSFKELKGDITLHPKTTQFGCAICLTLNRDEEMVPKTKEYDAQRVLITEQKAIHKELHTVQRDAFANNLDYCRRPNSNTLMILTDGMDQRKSRIPVLQKDIDTKDMDTIECHIFGCYAVGQCLHNYIDMKQIPHNSNQNISCILYIILEVAKTRTLPDHLLLQLDNTQSQNKNQWVFSFLALFVELGIFLSVTINFLMVGHTHNDIDRVFSYYKKAFVRGGNPTLADLLWNIHNSFEDKVDKLKPGNTINDETWAIDLWMKDHMKGLHGLSEYHGFRIARYPEVNNEVGLKYRLWENTPWEDDTKPIFNTIPTGKPPMEVPNYKYDIPGSGCKLRFNGVKHTVNKMQERESLSADQCAQWKETFSWIENQKKKWQKRFKESPVHKEKEKKKRNKEGGVKNEENKEGVEEAVSYVNCTWRQWPLDLLVEHRAKSRIEAPTSEFEVKSACLQYNPKHKVLNRYKKEYATPVYNDGENKITKYLDIYRSNVKPGMFGIVRGSTSDCLRGFWRPCDYPWVIKILSKLDDNDMFKYVYVKSPNEACQLKTRRYHINAPDPKPGKTLLEGSYDSLKQLFEKNSGFNSAGRTLRKHVYDQHLAESEKQTAKYDRMLKERQVAGSSK